jgi:hypothetical protein
MLIEIGSTVMTAEGPCGHLAAVLVDPVSGSATHVVIDGLPDVTPRLLPANVVRWTSRRSDLRPWAPVHVGRTVDEIRHATPAGTPTIVDAPQDLGHQPSAPLAPAGMPVWSLDQAGAWSWHGEEAAENASGRYRVISVPENPAGTLRFDRHTEVFAVDDTCVGTLLGLDLADDCRITGYVLDRHHGVTRRHVTIPTGHVTLFSGAKLRLDMTVDAARRPRATVG